MKKPKGRIKRPKAGLPANAVILMDENSLIINNHEPNQNLFEWISHVVADYDYDTIFTMLEEQGVSWEAASEHMISVLEKDVEPPPGFIESDPENAKKVEFANSRTGKKLKEGIIHIMQSSGSYWEFVENFKDDGRFIPRILEELEENLDSEDD